MAALRPSSKVLRIVERLTKALDELTAAIPRYRHYIRRFRDSVARVDRGEREYMCGPTIDFIHTIWFEFHEDILSVLGRPRDV